jgi:hypothetical protein
MSTTFTAPFAVDTAPDGLVADDQPAQQLALRAALRSEIGDADELGERFSTEKRHKKSLEFYQRLYEGKHSGVAAQSMLKRNRVNAITSSCNVAPDNLDLSWAIHRHFIDLKIFVGKGLGLGGMMPNQHTLHTYEFELNLRRPDRQFNTKFAQLGFDPVGCMLWIGRSPNAEDVWLAWAPNNALDGTEGDVTAGTCSGDTKMAEEHYRRAVMFLATCISEIRYRDALVEDEYPDVSDKIAFDLATNIM